MNLLKFGRVGGCWLLVLAVFALPACAKRAEVEPVEAPAPTPPQPKQPRPKPANAGKGGNALNTMPLGGLLGGGAPTSDEAKNLKMKYETQLLGTWTTDHGDGVTEELTYNPDSTFSAKLTGPEPATAAGKYTVLQLVGTKGLRVQLGAEPGSARMVTVSFDGDTIEHPSLRPGVTATFRKK